ALAGIIGTNLGSRRVEIVFDLPPEVPRWLLGDAMRLEQVLVNLLGNAIKFTEAGEVLLRIELVRLDADTVELRFLVSDTGIGISAQDLPQLFDAFMQGDAPLARRSGGVGLGLAICQRIVGLMGGRIEVRSEPGQGSEFSFAVPFGRSHRIPETPAVPENRSAIVAEDHPLAREVLARMLGGLGWRVVELDSAQAVRERLERARAGGERFDLLALDAGMAMQAQQSLLHDLMHDAVRDHGGERPRILLLANAIEQRELIAALDGFGLRNALLAKPVTCPALAAALARLRLGTANRGTDGPAGVHRQRIDGVRVLLVEDNEVNQVVAGRVLERAGARVSIAGDGRAAIDRVAADPDGFDVILMDIQLPEMDGYEVTRRIRQLPGWQERPIIALTAGVLDQNRERCLAAGMNEFIAKPIEPDRMIRTLIGAVGRSGPEAQEPAVRTVSRGTLPTVDGVDAGRALTLFADQRALFESMLVQFSDRYRTIMDEVRAGLADEQAEQA
ncbi:MAG: response regulator, partial [Rhodocyclaceae bacterium]|nr:response regulator [Rhodocyclaceae bacterium]